MDESAADERRNGVAKSADDRSPKLATRQARTPRRLIIHARPHAAGIAKYLANRDENRERRYIFKPDNRVKTDSKTNRADCGEHSLPWQGVMFQSTGDSTQFDRRGSTDRNTRSETEERAKA